MGVTVFTLKQAREIASPAASCGCRLDPATPFSQWPEDIQRDLRCWRHKDQYAVVYTNGEFYVTIPA